MFDLSRLNWLNPPKQYDIQPERISIITEPNTDLWQRTYYGFQNDNAPMLQMATDTAYFSFTVKTEFHSKQRFDQCGIVVYNDSNHWLKASVEFEPAGFQRLGSVVTNRGYSDWATTDIASDITEMWYRLSRRGSDFRVEYSLNGKDFHQMRICHLEGADATIHFGLYACSPENSSFEAVFSEFQLGECVWQEHQ